MRKTTSPKIKKKYREKREKFRKQKLIRRRETEERPRATFVNKI